MLNDAYNYEFINQYQGTRSPSGKVEYDYTTAYFMRCLYQRAISVFDFTLPVGWNVQYFKNVLFRQGFIGVIDTPKYGVIPQMCTLSGYGLYLQPTEILVKQPLVDFSGTIGDNCELIKLTPDYMGITDIVEHYARLLSTCLTSLNMSLENSRLAFILLAKNKQASATLKSIAERISSGEPVIIADKALKDDDLNGNDPIWTTAYNVKENYITDKLLENMVDLLASFDKEIGIPSVDEKRERVTNDEVAIQTADSCARLNTWVSCLNESVDNVNRLFGDKITAITFKSVQEKGVTNES